MTAQAARRCTVFLTGGNRLTSAPQRRWGAALCAAFLLVGWSRPSAAQQPGERIYAQTADSVVFLEITNASGDAIGTASGFLVGPDQVITNAHVVEAGGINMLAGSLRIPCTTRRTDVLNDLALCALAARSSAPAIKLATTDPRPGSAVYIISNPRGLDRTISQGLVTGVRQLDGRGVLQISAAMSQGSSGGPLLNDAGELIGVATSTRTDGQNLNFAAPLATVRDFLANRPTPATAGELLSTAKRLDAERVEFSNDPESVYQRTERRIRDLLSRAIEQAREVAMLEDIYDAGVGRAAIQVAAARKIVSLFTTPPPATLAELGRALYAEGSPASLAEAEGLVSMATATPDAPVEQIVLLGEIQSAAGRADAAYQTFLKAVAASGQDSDSAAAAHWNLFATASTLGRTADADRWFAKIRPAATPLQWFFYGRHLDDLQRYADAGDAFAQASGLAPTASHYACEAGQSYYSGDKLDEALQFLRRCIELASHAGGQERLIGNTHEIIAAILTTRGVYDAAANHARQAVTLDATNAWAYHSLAKALAGQRRFTEAVSAAKTALRLSDGKFGAMHFTLGGAYFELEQWPEAKQAYQKSAELSPKDPAPAFNVAVSLYNDRSYSQALTWYQEVLRRDPTYHRDEVVRTVNELQRRR